MNEVQHIDQSGLTLYFTMLNAGNIGQTTTQTFVPIVGANWTNYDNPLVEQGTTGVYLGSIPAWVNTAMKLSITAYKRLGPSAAQGDEPRGMNDMDWTGTAEGSGGGGGDDIIVNIDESVVNIEEEV